MEYDNCDVVHIYLIIALSNGKHAIRLAVELEIND